MRSFIVMINSLIMIMLITLSQAQAKQDVSATQVSKYVTTYVMRYEKIRVLLAQDELAKSTTEALRVHHDLNTLLKTLSSMPSLQKQFQAMANAALQMKQSKTADEQRKAFGDMSKVVITLLNQHKDLQKGWYVFMCPMAQGYSKWIQASADMANPYMGKRMLKCGSSTQWTP